MFSMEFTLEMDVGKSNGLCSNAAQGFYLMGIVR